MKAETGSRRMLAQPTQSDSGEQANLAGFEWAVTLFSLWMIGGVYLDAWAHHRYHMESFFTPWHGVLYSGYLAAAALLFFTFVRNLRAGAAWRKALPSGYGLSLVGAGVFLAGGAGDLVWHTLFGIEVNLEALLSPTHLLLAVGGALIVSGPLRAAWHRKGAAPPGWPALLSLSLLLAILVFFSAYAHPLIDGGDTTYAGSSRGLVVAGILLQSGLLVGTVLFALRRWRLPAGSLSLIIGLSTALAVGIREEFVYLPAALLAGILSDGLLVWLKPSAQNIRPARWLAMAVPASFWSLYFITRQLSGHFDWTIHLWAGSILLAGMVGLLLSYAYFPPPMQAE